MIVPTTPQLSRRGFLATASGALVAGCTARDDPEVSRRVPRTRPDIYDAVPGERFPVPAVDLEEVAPQYWRTTVNDPTGEPPGTIVVSTPARYLYFTQADGRAVRYGVGVGEGGFAWAGSARVQFKRKCHAGRRPMQWSRANLSVNLSQSPTAEWTQGRTIR